MTTGEAIGMMAKQKGFNLRQLAAKAEVPYNTLYAIVKRKSSRIDVKTLRRVANALEVSIDELEPFTPNLMRFNADEAWVVNPRFDTVITTRMIDADSKEARKAAKDDVLRLLKSFDMLDEDGQKKAIELLDILTKVPEYYNPEANETYRANHRDMRDEIFYGVIDVQKAESAATIYDLIAKLLLAYDTEDEQAQFECMKKLIIEHENIRLTAIEKRRVKKLRNSIEALIAAHRDRNEDEEHRLIAEFVDTSRIAQEPLEDIFTDDILAEHDYATEDDLR